LKNIHEAKVKELEVLAHRITGFIKTPPISGATGWGYTLKVSIRFGRNGAIISSRFANPSHQ
jgi:hypothetical protein